MFKAFEQEYYHKKLHFDAGRTILDNLYSHYRNSVNIVKLYTFVHTIQKQIDTEIDLSDSVGVCFDLLCRMFIEQQADCNTVFVYKDDLFTDKIMAVYDVFNQIYIYSNPCGDPLDCFYFNKNEVSKQSRKYIHLAQFHFQQSL